MKKHRMNLPGLFIDKSWTLFLDRDGVINRRIEGGYVTRWDEFVVQEGVQEAFSIFSEIFGRIIVVSNQQGVGKGLVSMEQVVRINREMVRQVKTWGGRIDQVYFSPYLATDRHPDRKPGIGMALKAKSDFPDIDFQKSVMVGDSFSDIEFGKNAGMYTVYLGEISLMDEQTIVPDWFFPDLVTLARLLKTLKNTSA